MLKVLLAVSGTFFLFSFIHYAGKKKKPFRGAFLSMLVGVAALTLVDLLSRVTGVYVPITQLSLMTSVIGGVPGVALLVLLSV